jgi:hypothetical protein
MENLENGILMISEEHVDYIKAIAGEFDYKPTIVDASGEEVVNTESPLYRQKYRRFAYSIGGKDQVFIADVRDKFCAQYDAESLWTVRLTVNEAGQLSNPIGLTTARAEKTALTKRKLNVIANAPMSTEAVSEDLMADITNSSIG